MTRRVALLVALVLCFNAAHGAAPKVVITSPDKQTVPIGASALLTTQSPIDWNIAAGVGVLTTIPILIFSIFVQRYIVRGMTAGAIR